MDLSDQRIMREPNLCSSIPAAFNTRAVFLKSVAVNVDIAPTLAIAVDLLIVNTGAAFRAYRSIASATYRGDNTATLAPSHSSSCTHR